MRRLIVLSIISLIGLSAGCPAADERPHIILMMADDLGYGDVGYLGHPTIKTPVLDDLATQGIRMDLFFTCGQNCSPTRASCLTGRHHDRSGVHNHSMPIAPGQTTVAHALKSVGYKTAIIGKWHLGKVKETDHPTHPMVNGFDETFVTDNNSEKVDPEDYYHNGQAVGVVEGEDSHILVERTLAWLARHRRTPTLTYLWFHTPHTPYGSTKEYLDMYPEVSGETRAYYAQITAMDHAIGTLVDGLKKMKIHDNTLLVFCSDNGARKPGSNAFLKGRKGAIATQGAHRVPALAVWPGRIPARTERQIAFSTNDFYPTFLAAAGITGHFGPERTIDGDNVLAIWQGKATERRKPVVYGQAYGKGRSNFWMLLKGTQISSPNPKTGKRKSETVTFDDGGTSDGGDARIAKGLEPLADQLQREVKQDVEALPSK